MKRRNPQLLPPIPCGMRTDPLENALWIGALCGAAMFRDHRFKLRLDRELHNLAELLLHQYRPSAKA